MADYEGQEKPGLARRLFRAVGQAGSAAASVVGQAGSAAGRAVGQAGSAAGRAVGQAGSAVGGAAEGLIRTAGQTARTAGSRALVSLSGEVDETPPRTVRDLAESLTRWLVEEHQGRADLQKQKPSTIELTEFEQEAALYEVVLEEPGLMGRRLRFVFRHRPLTPWLDNLPTTDQEFKAQAVVVLDWPKELWEEPSEVSFLIWDQAAVVGERNAAQDLCQRWIKSELEGTFRRLQVLPGKQLQARPRELPIFGRDEALREAYESLLLPPSREQRQFGILSIAAPGGTGKSYFLKTLKERLKGRVTWAGVDHQGLEEGAESVDVLARILSTLAFGLEEEGVPFANFSKEYRSFKKRRASAEGEASGFLAHLRKAAETAAGINPVIGAASAGVTFLTSWGQEVKEESEALAKNDDLTTLTNAFVQDLARWRAEQASEALLWLRPILVLDTYEWLAPLVDTWVRTTLVTEEFFESTGAVLVLAGRDRLLRTNTRWSEWQHRTLSLVLEPFDKETSRAYLESLKADPERADELYELTEGSPLFLSLVAQIEDPEEAISILSERILEEVTEESWNHFRRASLAENFDPETLATLYPELDGEERTKLLKRLKKASFTVASKGKRCFLPSVRKLLRSSFVLEVGQSQVDAHLKNLSADRV